MSRRVEGVLPINFPSMMISASSGSDLMTTVDGSGCCGAGKTAAGVGSTAIAGLAGTAKATD